MILCVYPHYILEGGYMAILCVFVDDKRHKKGGLLDTESYIYFETS